MLYWLGLILAAGYLGHGRVAPTIGVFLAGVVLAYLVSLHRHPFRVCRACNGSGRHRGVMFPWSQRACTACGGQSRHRRWGTQALRGKPGERTWGEQAAKDAGARRGAPR